MISLIVPSRNRPDSLKRLYDSWVASNAKGQLIVVLDEDDSNSYNLPGAVLVRLWRGNAIEKINWGAAVSAGEIIGFCGDDCVIETKNWEQRITDTMTEPLSLMWVSDGWNKYQLPTHPFMSRELYNKLGWFALPDITHCFADHVWRKIGDYLAVSGKGLYWKVDDVVFRHHHPDYDDSVAVDAIYEQAYDGEQAAIDKKIFENYKPSF